MPDLTRSVRYSCTAGGTRSHVEFAGGKPKRHAASASLRGAGNRWWHFLQRTIGGQPDWFSEGVRCDLR
ncbi:MAG: hypothetical protein ACYDA9_00135 [Terriglobia bacterium]